MELKIKTMADFAAEGLKPEYLFWVGCAGSFDARAQKVVAAFCELMERAGISYGILGNEESCTGDPARRSGNEFLFQMLAQANIQVLNEYKVQKIVTTCPHCLNTLKNEYPELGGSYEVIHHTALISSLIKAGKLEVDHSDQNVTYHDSCYLGRINGDYENPRDVLKAMNGSINEMKRSKENGMCCGAGGAQMFKEEEDGTERVNIDRAKEAIETGADVVAVNCPFCLTMMTDGIKAADKQDSVMTYDLAELVLNNLKK